MLGKGDPLVPIEEFFDGAGGFCGRIWGADAVERGLDDVLDIIARFTTIVE